MSPAWGTALRVVAGLAGAALLVAGCVLGYIAVVAVRRSEGVFLPAGYVALLFLASGGWLVWYAMRG